MAHMQRLLGFLCLALFAGSGLAQDQAALKRLGYTVEEDSRLTDTTSGSRTFEYGKPPGPLQVRLMDREYPSVAKESERHQLLFMMQVSVKEGRSPQSIVALTPKLVAAAEQAVRDNPAVVAGLGYLAAAGSGVSTTALQSAVLSYLHRFQPPTAPMGEQIPGVVFSDEYGGSPDRHQLLALGQPGWKINASRGFHARLGISSLSVEVVAKIPLKGSTTQEAKPTSQSEPTSSAPTIRGPNNNSPVIWTGQAGRFLVRWTESDISAWRDGKAVFSTRALTEQDTKDMEPSAEYSRKFALLSVVGSVISYSDSSYCDCGGAHPTSEARFSAVDLDHPGQPARLTDSFAESDVLRALLKDTLVRKATAATGRAPQTLTALAGVSITSKGCSFSADSDLPTRFAFHHVEGSQVAVRIALSHDVEACRGQMVQLGVLLPIPERLRTSLESAQAGTSGFLMKDAARISGGRSASLDWKAK